ncbi:MAG: SDR family oxidoreductase [Oscillospiraceae bacterium]
MKESAVSLPPGSKVLVTGSAGFIGSNLVEALLEQGVEVTGLDNFSGGLRENVEEFAGNSLYHFIEGDICDMDTCLRASDGADYILHQAALGSVPRSMREPLLYVKNNVEGTSNIFDAARQNGVKRVVYASSSSVYGDSQELPKREDKTGNPLSPYALSKAVNEQYAALYGRLYGLSCIGLRYFNVFGPRQNPDSPYAALIPLIFKHLESGQAMKIFGDGEQSRDFTYIGNVIQANIRACLAGEDAGGSAYNIAYGERYTVNEVYAIIADAVGSSQKPEYAQPRAGDILHSLADTSRAREMLGYLPRWDFKAGIAEALAWYLA